MVSVTGVTGSDARDGERKGKGNVDWITISSEANFPSGETLETTQGRVSARTPRTPNAKGSLAYVDVARTIASVPVAPMDARSTD